MREENYLMRILKILGRVGLTVLVTVAGLLIALLVVIFILEKGPSQSAKVTFVHSCKESSAMGFLTTIFLSQEEVDEIMSNKEISELDDGEHSDTDAIIIDEDEVTDEIEVVEVSGGSYKGVMLIIHDPSRVFVGTVEKELGSFGEFNGQTVIDMIASYNATGDYHIIAGINGGSFIDAGSYAYTAQPMGAVISEGEVVYSAYGDDYSYHLAGFTEDNKFIVGELTLTEAKELGLRDAVFCEEEVGPFLIMNGESRLEEVPDSSNYGSGKNPRTAIGQREDGTVLMLVIDGRQANSLGATFKDLVLIMQEYGAYNAAAMDGGTSSQMIYEVSDGEYDILNNPYSPTGPRKCPTAWFVQ